jgi:predicted phage-related endonuclease
LNALAAFIHPCQPFVAKQPPAGSGWAHKLKHDGYHGTRPRVLLMDEFDKPRLEYLAKLAEQLASLQNECSELRRELDERIKMQQEQLTQLAALKAKYDQLCRERDDFRKALEEQLRLNPAFCVMPDPNTEH